MIRRRVASTGGSPCGLEDDPESCCATGEEMVKPTQSATLKCSVNTVVITIPSKVWILMSIALSASVFGAFCALAEDTSSLFTLASAFQFVGVQGLFDSQHALHTCTAKLVICAWTFRLTTILATNGYTPIDSTGDWLHTVLECACLLCMIGAYMKHTRWGPAKTSAMECVRVRSEWMIVLAIVLFSLVLGNFCHLGLVGFSKNGTELRTYIKYDVLWAASVYIESVALIPQVIHMSRSAKVARQNAQFVSMSFVARACGLLFWLVAVQDMNDSISSDLRTAATLILVAHIIQLLSVSHVTFLYLRDKLHAAADIITNEFTCTIV